MFTLSRIVANAIEKWDAFLKITDINKFDGFSNVINSLQIAFTSKHFEDFKLSYETCSRRCELIKQEFGKFSNICSERSEICKHRCGVLNLIILLIYELLNPLKNLLDTSDYQFGKTEVTGLAVVVDFMSVIHKIECFGGKLNSL